MRSVIVVRQGALYGPEHVSALERQVYSNSRTPPRFVCLSDGENEAETRPLRQGWKGWWSKLEVVAPWNEDLRPALFLDLDTYVLGSIDDLLLEGSRFMMLRDFNMPEQGQSSVMLVPRETNHIWAVFNEKPEMWMQKYRAPGDQAYFNQFKEGFIQDSFAGIYSYKKHCRLEPRGRIVCFHGKPKPPHVEGWAKDFWDSYAASS